MLQKKKKIKKKPQNTRYDLGYDSYLAIVFTFMKNRKLNYFLYGK